MPKYYIYMNSKENIEKIDQSIYGLKDSQETYAPIPTKNIKKILILQILTTQ